MEVYKTCRQTAAYCANEQGDYAAPARIQVLHDCAEIHLLTGDLIARSSPYHQQLARLAGEVAHACAEAFRDVEHGDPYLRKLYAVCMQSVKSLRIFLGEAEDTPVYTRADHASKGSFPASDPPPTSGI